MALAAPQAMETAAEGDSFRRCIVTGAVLERERMVRFVVGPDGGLIADVAGRLPGRGMWVAAGSEALSRACRKQAFARAAKAAVTVPDGLVERVELLLARQCLSLIAFARRAGKAVCGAEKTRAWLKGGGRGLLILAADGSPGETAQMRALAPELKRIETLTAAELGSVFGRERTVHAAVAAGRLADRIAIEAGRLAGFREPRAAAAGPERTEAV